MLSIASENTEKLKHEIQKLKRENAALRRNEERLHHALQAGRLGLFDWDITTGQNFCTPRYFEIFGMNGDAAMPSENDWLSRVHPDDRKRVRYKVRRALAGKKPYESEYRILRPGGWVRWVGSQARVFFNTAGEPYRMIGTVADITERRKAEKFLADSEQILSFHIQKMPLAYIRFDTNLRVVDWNPAATKIFGFTASEVRGKVLIDQLVPEAVRPHVYNLLQEIITGEGGHYSVNENLTRSGRTITCEWFNTPLRDRAGQITGVACFALDITDRIRAEAELNATMDELERSNSELEQFAYIASHDLQEPLRKITAFVDRLDSRIHAQLDEKSLDYMARIKRSAVRMKSLIEDLLNYSRVVTQAKPMVPSDLNALVEEVLQELEMRIETSKPRVHLENLPQMSVDRNQIKQLFQNLISNAIKFRKPDHTPVIHIKSRKEANSWVITVIDNGIGFDQKYINKIFRPFQRLHGRLTYEGSGMGLAICRKVAERHGGTISARSSPGEGASFIIRLPQN